MSYITKPKVHHPSLQRNAVGLTRRDYEGTLHYRRLYSSVLGTGY